MSGSKAHELCEFRPCAGPGNISWSRADGYHMGVHDAGIEHHRAQAQFIP